MNYKLIMLPQPILVSDEEIKPNDKFYNIQSQNIFDNYSDSVLSKIQEIEFKIIAGIPELPSLDLSAIAEEIELVDVEKQFKSLMKDAFENPENVNQEGLSLLFDYYKQGFKTAQSLNEKKFSEEDLKSFAIYCADNHFLDDSDKTNIFWDPIFKDGKKLTMIQMFENWKSLSQPKVYRVEPEIEYKDMMGIWYTKPTILSELDRPQRLKITNNTIKVIKVL